jgi:hypothetical protein
MRRFIAPFAAALIILGLPDEVPAGQVDYAATRTGQYGTLNLQTGVFTSISAPGNGFEDLTRLPGGPLYAVDSSSHLLLMNAATGSSNVIGTTGGPIFAAKLRADGTMFGLSSTSLYTIDTATASDTLIGSLGISSTYYDLSFDNSGHLFLESSNGSTASLYSVNQTNGQATLIGSTGFNVGVLNFENGMLYGLTLNTSTQQLVSINTATGAGTLIADVSGVPGGGLIYGFTTSAAAVPEPSSWVILSLGLATLGGAHGIRRRCSAQY